jgi:hypothetical protein
MEKRKAEEEKRMNWIKNLDGGKSRKTKAKTRLRGAAISTAVVPEWNDDSRPDSQHKCINPANRLLLHVF